MKVGIITFHQAVNYGAVLQAYALCTAVRELGAECDIINYSNPVIERQRTRISLKNSKNLRQVVSSMLYGRVRNRKIELFKAFEEEFSFVSDKCYTTDSIGEAVQEYDIIITGSDQVWNLELTGDDYHYFLDFVPDEKKKCSYAASISSKVNTQEAIIKSLLQRFDYISLREKAGRDYVKALLGTNDVKVVLDPTLLLDSAKWMKSMNGYREKIRCPEKYLLAYFVSPHNEHYDEAIRIGKEMNLPIVLINYTHRKVSGVINCREVSPAGFVKLINDAAFVVTNSFHGTAFSINLNKEFVFILNEEKPEKNERINTITRELGLESRNYKIVDLAKKIDWKNVNKKLENLRTDSREELKNDILGL